MGPLCDDSLCDCESDQHHKTFYNQQWSRWDIKARIRLDEGAYNKACAKLFEGSSFLLLQTVRKYLGRAARLAERIEFVRICDMFVPNGFGHRVSEALSLLPQPKAGLSIGLAPYESKDTDNDWEGTALVFHDIVSNLLFDSEVVEQFRAKCLIDEHYETPGFRLDTGVDQEAVLKVMPRVQSFFEQDLPLESLCHFSETSRINMKSLGCVLVESCFDWHELPVFAQVDFVSVRIKDFRLGSSSWPILRVADESRPIDHAKSLASWLAAAFPAVNAVHFFFDFDDPLLEQPHQDLVRLIDELSQSWQALRQHLDVRYTVRLYGTYFDSLANIRELVTHGDRLQVFYGHLQWQLFGLAFRSNSQGESLCERQAQLDRRNLPRVIAGLASLVGRAEANQMVAHMFSTFDRTGGG